MLRGILLLIGLVPGVVLSQTSMDGGARVAAMGGAATALPEEVWGEANPATWATLPGRAVSFFATEAFGMGELRMGAVQAAQPTQWGTLALGGRTFGFEDYRETHVSAGFARGFALGTARHFHLGAQLGYQRVSIPGYGAAGALTLGVGWMVNLSPALYAGFHATNLHAPDLGGDELPRTFSLGVAYTAFERLRVVADLHKDVRFPVSARAGVEVQPVEVLYLRAGAASQPARFSAGAGVRLGKINADVAGERHEVLGWSPAVGLGLQW